MKTHLFLYSAICAAFIAFPGCVHHNRAHDDTNRFEISSEPGEPDSVTNDKGDYRYEKRTLKSEGIEKVRLDLGFPAGYYNITGGAAGLLEGKFKFHKDKWELESSEKTHNSIADVTLKLSKTREIDLPHEKNVANIAINSRIPTEVEVGFGAGEGRFDFRNTNITRANFELGAGEFEIKLGNTSLNELEISAGVGQGTVDLSGEWKQNLDADFSCGIGDLTLILPSSAGVEVEVHGLIGDISHFGLAKEGHTYTNDAYKKAKFRLKINVSGGIGSLHMRVE